MRGVKPEGDKLMRLHALRRATRSIWFVRRHCEQSLSASATLTKNGAGVTVI